MNREGIMNQTEIKFQKRIGQDMGIEIDNVQLDMTDHHITHELFTVNSELDAYKAAYARRHMGEVKVAYSDNIQSWYVSIERN